LVRAPEIWRRSELVVDIDHLVSALRVLAIAGALIAFGWALRNMRRESAGQQELLERLRTEQQAARGEIRALAEKVGVLATLVANLATRVEQPAAIPASPPRREPSAARSYETARRLARSGATLEEIVATSGVASSEARLLQRLHSGGVDDRESAA
jgi:hypothetical protein